MCTTRSPAQESRGQQQLGSTVGQWDRGKHILEFKSYEEGEHTAKCNTKVNTKCNSTNKDHLPFKDIIKSVYNTNSSPNIFFTPTMKMTCISFHVFHISPYKTHNRVQPFGHQRLKWKEYFPVIILRWGADGRYIITVWVMPLMTGTNESLRWRHLLYLLRCDLFFFLTLALIPPHMPAVVSLPEAIGTTTSMHNSLWHYRTKNQAFSCWLQFLLSFVQIIWQARVFTT